MAQPPIRLVHYIRQFAVSMNTNKPNRNKWLNNANKIEEFEKFMGLEMNSDMFNKIKTDSYLYFLKSSSKNYKTSTIISFYSKLSEALKYAKSDGYKVHEGYKDISLIPEDSCTVPLNEAEIQKLFSLKPLRKNAHAVRERMVIGCHTGLRFSDLKLVTAEHFNINYFSTNQLKTKGNAVIPVHWHIKEIIKRNRGILSPIPSQQSFGKTIKRICKKAGITQKVLYEQTEGLRFVRKWVPKYTLISSHTCRRSIANNLYLRAIPVRNIMMITGHKTEEAFFRYIRIHPIENAIELSNHPYFSNKPICQDKKVVCSKCGKKVA